MKKTIVALSALICLGASAQQYVECLRGIPEHNIPQFCVLRGTPEPKPQPVVSPGPSHAEVARGDADTLRRANAHADQGAADTLQQAGASARSGDAAMLSKASAGIAQSAALVHIEPLADGETTVNVAAATYGGQSAMGISMARRLGAVTVSAGVGTTGGGSSVARVGLGWRF